MNSQALTAFIVLSANGLFAQTPAFEVASVKPNVSASGNSGMRRSGGRIILENYSLKQLIKTAYDVKEFSFSGPSWLEDYRFDVEAKPPAGAPVSSDFRPMLQTLLADRFKLAVHRETRTLPAYALLVDKKGPKLRQGTVGRNSWSFGRGVAQGNNISMPGFAEVLSDALGRPVKDMTNLSGSYDIKLTWTPEDSDAASVDARTPNSIFTAVQEQLGLRLEGRKLPIEILVVDHTEKLPTEN